jgi:hypothetical protein
MFDEKGALAALQVLIGEPFTGVSRALDLGVISFGAEVSWVDAQTGEPRKASRYAVHASCPFRVTRLGRLLVGSDDIRHRRPDRPDGTQSVFDRDAALLDSILSSMPVSVMDVSVTFAGDIHFELGDDMRVEVFPASSHPDPAWRFLHRDAGEHLVFPPAP